MRRSGPPIRPQRQPEGSRRTASGGIAVLQAAALPQAEPSRGPAWKASAGPPCMPKHGGLVSEAAPPQGIPSSGRNNVKKPPVISGKPIRHTKDFFQAGQWCGEIPDMVTSGKAAGGVLSVRNAACFTGEARRGRREGTTEENDKQADPVGSGPESGVEAGPTDGSMGRRGSTRGMTPAARNATRAADSKIGVSRRRRGSRRGA